jgi:hypothetical protein
VSAIGEGNTEAGDYILSLMFVLEQPQAGGTVVDVLCSCGEWIVRPDRLALHHGTSLSEAHDQMDRWILKQRRECIAPLGELPRPQHCVLPEEKPRRKKKRGT